eukprot:scaffold38043_cov176-Amphora_coffeaeformis.AAC.7
MDAASMTRRCLCCLLTFIIWLIISLTPCIAFLLSYQWRTADGIVSLAKKQEAGDERPKDASSVDPRPSASRTTNPFPILQWNVSSILNVNNTAKLIQLRQVYQDALKVLEKTQKITSLEYGCPPSDGQLDPFDQVRRFLQSYSHDRGNHGRFAIPIEQYCDHDSTTTTTTTTTTTGGYSMPANLAFSMNEPLSYIRDNLSYSYRPSMDEGSEYHTHDSTHQQENKEELVVVLPGLHTTIQSAWDQVRYLSQVMDGSTSNGMSMALLQVGTFANDEIQKNGNDTVVVEIAPDTWAALKSLKLIVMDQNEQTPSSPSKRRFRIQLGDLDLLRALVVAQSYNIDTEVEESDPLIEALVKLLDISVNSILRTEQRQQQPRLVLLSSCVNSHYVVAAIQRWKYLVVLGPFSTAELRCAGLVKTEEHAEELLREAVTIVTLGSLCQIFPDGPAYLHISMHDDQWANQFGIHRDNVDYCGGKDAVLLQAISPYKTHTITDKDQQQTDHHQLCNSDAHNFLACAIQFLSLLLRVNGLSTFRELHHGGRQPTPELDIQPSLFALNYDSTIGNLEIPQDELLLAVLQATGAERWSWWPFAHDDDSPLPDVYDAKATMAEHFGY